MAKQRRRVPRYQREVEGQARKSGQWNPRFCTKEFYDYMMAQMPKGAIPADMTKHAAHNSYGPPFWYQDCEFVCQDCGNSEIWTAEAQRWWYEEAKGLIYSRAVRCRECRKARRDSHCGTPRRSHAERRQRVDAEPDAAPDRSQDPSS